MEKEEANRFTRGQKLLKGNQIFEIFNKRQLSFWGNV